MAAECGVVWMGSISVKLPQSSGALWIVSIKGMPDFCCNPAHFLPREVFSQVPLGTMVAVCLDDNETHVTNLSLLSPPDSCVWTDIEEFLS